MGLSAGPTAPGPWDSGHCWPWSPRVRWRWPCRRGERGSPAQPVPGGHFDLCAHSLGSNPRADGTVAPKHGTQDNDPQVPARNKSVFSSNPQDRGVQSGGSSKGAYLQPVPARVPLRPLHGAERPWHPGPGRTEGPVLPLVPSLSPAQVEPGPGEPARAASQVFQHLPPTESAGRRRGPCTDSPWAAGLTTTKPASTPPPASARSTWFSSSVLGNG